jgi:integrase
LAVEEEFITHNPARNVRRLRPDNCVVRFLTSEEEERLLAELTGDRAHLRPIVIIALHTGMRRGEILSLRRSQLQFEMGERGVIELTNTKSGNVRVIPMNSLVRMELLALSQNLPMNAPVFPSTKTKRALTDIKKGFRYALRAAGISGFRFHDLRHTFGTRLAEANVPVHQIADLMGHSDYRMTQRYVHASGAGKFAAVETLVNRRK